MRTWVAPIALVLCLLTSAAKASAVVECVEETGQKQISLHLDMRNCQIGRDGDLKSNSKDSWQ